ncbi:MAG: rod shape-determining protein MreC [Bryobacteraceae bacterium]|jgi:rod shape-determining protein MreC
MESLFYRYRNIIVLLLVIFAQLVLLAWQVKSDNDVPMVRVWAVTAVTPVASAIEAMRNGTTGFFSSYFELRNARAQSRQLRTEVDRLRLENQLLKNDLASAQRAESLAGFQARSLSKMIGARVIGATPGVGTKSVLIDRGTTAGVRRGMAVVTPDGIVGRVVAVFPFASQVLSVTDPGFAAGVESQKNHVHGVLKGLGNDSDRVDFVPTGQKVEVGEMFFTSGEDRVFPKGLPVGKVTGVHEGGNFQDITVDPSGTGTAPEEVLVILDAVHQAIPEETTPDTPVYLTPDVNPDGNSDARAPQSGALLTTADKLRDQYKKIGDAQKHVFGEGLPGTPPPNFNLKVPGVNAPAEPATTPPATTSPATTPPVPASPKPAPPAQAPPTQATPKPQP